MQLMQNDQNSDGTREEKKQGGLWELSGKLRKKSHSPVCLISLGKTVEVRIFLKIVEYK